jgi:hypothetical protein
LDREALIDRFYMVRVKFLRGFILHNISLFVGNLTDTEFDPVAGRALLEDADGSILTGIRLHRVFSSGVEGVPDGTEFAVTLETSESPKESKRLN